MVKREKGGIGMDETFKVTTTKVDTNDTTCHRIIGDPIPPTTICTHFPQILQRIRVQITRIIRIADRKRVFEIEQSRGLV